MKVMTMTMIGWERKDSMFNNMMLVLVIMIMIMYDTPSTSYKNKTERRKIPVWVGIQYNVSCIAKNSIQMYKMYMSSYI